MPSPNIYDDNHLSGSIPKEIGNLTKLRFLTIQLNQLSGSIPSSTGNLINLYSFDMGNNQLSGIIPPEIGNLTNINLFKLNDNQLCGEIPTNLTNMITLADGYGINLDNNYLFTNDTTLDAFLIQKGGEWKSLQGEICPSNFPWMPLFHIILKGKKQ
jgi:Leucine-rich repeat (LRR) protein